MQKGEDYDLLYDRADQYAGEGRIEKAIDLYKQLLVAYPYDDSLIISMAWAYRDSGDTGKAIGCLEGLLERELMRDVFTGFAYDELVRMFRETGDNKRLIDLCEKVAAVQPGDAALLATLGESCLRVGKNERAIEVFEMLISMEPDSLSYFCRLGSACVAAGDFDRAEIAYEEARRIEPGDSGVLFNRLGNAYAQVGAYERAEAALEKSLNAKADEPLYNCNLGDVYIKQGKIEAARKSYENAGLIDNSSRGVYFNRLGNSLSRAGFYGDAIRAYEEAINAEPNNRFYYVSHSEACIKAGWPERVTLFYEQVKSRGILS